MTSILFLSYWSCPLTEVGIGKSGGMSIFLRNLASSLGKNGNHVDIYTKSHAENHEEESINENVRVIHVDAQDVNTYIQNVNEEVKKSEKKYDFIYSHYYLSGIAGIEIKKALNIPLFHTFHSLQSLKDVFEENDSKRTQLEEKVCKEVDQIITLSNIETQVLKTDYNVEKDKITIITPGVDHKLFHEMNKIDARTKVRFAEEKTIFLFVGRLEKIKGIELVVNAYKKFIKNNKQNIELVIIGEGDKEFLVEMPQREKISYLGNKRYRDLPLYYAASDVLIIPSYAESFGLTALEAMAMGLPIIASKVGGLVEMVKDNINGYLFDPGSEEDLIKKMEQLANNSAHRLEMGKNGNKMSMKYSWNKMANDVINLYHEKYG